MAFIRLFDFALLSFLVWLVWSQVIRGWRSAGAAPADSRRRTPPSRPSSAAAAPEPPPLTLVPCSACGVHVPSGRTLPGTAGEVFCSEACRSRDAARRAV